MTAGITTAFWSMTINNPSPAQITLIKQGYSDYCREIVWTLEQGKEGTPHIQAYVKLQRQQRQSFMRKLFPGGHFRPLLSDEYVHNTKDYAQKDDDTTQSAHRHVFNDPMGTIESLIKKVISVLIDKNELDPTDFRRDRWSNDTAIRACIRDAERSLVQQDYKNAKIFVSASYKAMWKDFGPEMFVCLYNLTHTHTHTQDEDSSQHVDIPTNADEDTRSEEGLSQTGWFEASEGSEDYQEGESEASEGLYESGSSVSGSSYD